MRRLFRTCPEAVDESAKILDRIAFSLRDPEYEYPHDPVPAGWEPQSWLEHRVMGAANKLPPAGQIGRAHVCIPVTNAHLVCRFLLEKSKLHNSLSTISNISISDSRRHTD